MVIGTWESRAAIVAAGQPFESHMLIATLVRAEASRWSQSLLYVAFCHAHAVCGVPGVW
jgi:hypothetical protein